MNTTQRLAAGSGDASDSAVLALREKADRAYARYSALRDGATTTAEEIENECEGSEADMAWKEFHAADLELIAMPASTPRGVLAKLGIVLKFMNDDCLASEPGLIPALRGRPDDYLDPQDRAIVSAARDLAAMCGADPVPATLHGREKAPVQRSRRPEEKFREMIEAELGKVPAAPPAAKEQPPLFGIATDVESVVCKLDALRTIIDRLAAEAEAESPEHDPNKTEMVVFYGLGYFVEYALNDLRQIVKAVYAASSAAKGAAS